MSGMLSLSMHRRAKDTTGDVDMNSLTTKTQNSSFYSESTSTNTLASERWSIEKKRIEWDQELAKFREKQIQKMRYIKISSGYVVIIIIIIIIISVKFSVF